MYIYNYYKKQNLLSNIFTKSKNQKFHKTYIIYNINLKKSILI